MDRGAWWATVHGVAKGSNVTEQLNNNNSKLYEFTIHGDVLVNVHQSTLQKGEGGALIYCSSLFPWSKYSHCGCFQTTSVTSLDTHLRSDAHN